MLSVALAVGELTVETLIHLPPPLSLFDPNLNPLTPVKIMLTKLERFIDWLCGHPTEPIEPEPEPLAKTRWVVDLPPREAMRLGSFRTKQEALDYRREYIIRSIRETEPIELPF